MFVGAETGFTFDGEEKLEFLYGFETELLTGTGTKEGVKTPDEERESGTKGAVWLREFDVVDV